MRLAALLATIVLSSSATAKDAICHMDKYQEEIINSLFAKKEHIYSLLWWTEAKKQVADSGYENDLVGIDPGLLAGILQRMEYAVLNPGSSQPIQFKTCILEPYIRVPSA